MEKLERTEFIRRFKEEDERELEVVLVKHNKSKDAFMRLVKEYTGGRRLVGIVNRYEDEAFSTIESENFVVVYLSIEKAIASVRVFSIEEYKFTNEALIEELAVERINIDKAIDSFKREDVRRKRSKKKAYNPKLDESIGKKVFIPVYLEERLTHGEYSNEPKNGFLVRTMEGDEIHTDLSNGVIFPEDIE